MVTLQDPMDPRDNYDTVGSSGTKDITVELLGHMVPRGQSEAAGLCGTKSPLSHYRVPWIQGTIVTLWGPRGTKNITVALLGPMVPRAQCEAAGLCGTKRPLLHYRASCSQRAVVILQGTVDPWRLCGIARPHGITETRVTL